MRMTNELNMKQLGVGAVSLGGLAPVKRETGANPVRTRHRN